MWARGEKLPSQLPNSMMRCPCGERFDSHDPAESYVHREPSMPLSGRPPDEVRPFWVCEGTEFLA
jgi:hypothetical protein